MFCSVPVHVVVVHLKHHVRITLKYLGYLRHPLYGPVFVPRRAEKQADVLVNPESFQSFVGASFVEHDLFPES